MENRIYLCIDLKSFYASVECVERGLDPLTVNLAVADPKRGDRTICLAISPSMKALGIRNRCRVFQIPEGVEYIMALPEDEALYCIFRRHLCCLPEIYRKGGHPCLFDRRGIFRCDRLSVFVSDGCKGTGGKDD